MERVCVFLGSSLGARPAYARAVPGLVRALSQRGLGLVYGGARVGLMGCLADAALAAGLEVIGVIPEMLAGKEVAHAGLADLRVVDSMHARKALMAELSDAFVALPGGIGTLEELLEVLTWAQLGLHDKPCGLLDVDGYYAGLAGFLDHAVAERFLPPEHRRALLLESDAALLLDRFAAYRAPGGPKWIDARQT